jgi:hypothetical protein
VDEEEEEEEDQDKNPTTCCVFDGGLELRRPAPEAQERLSRFCCGTPFSM